MLKSVRMIAILAVSGASIAQTPTFSAEQRADGERQIISAGKMLSDSLRDTATAKFRNVTLFKTVGRDSKEHVSFCGEVNSKNGYGGMSGFQKFTTVGTMLIVGQSSFISAEVVCSDATPRVHDARDYTPELRKAFDANAGG